MKDKIDLILEKLCTRCSDKGKRCGDGYHCLCFEETSSLIGDEILKYKKPNVSESIFSNERYTIPMADVQHIEHKCNPNGKLYGAYIVTKHTKYNPDIDDWENAIWMNKKELEDFKKAWCYYRYEYDKISGDKR